MSTPARHTAGPGHYDPVLTAVDGIVEALDRITAPTCVALLGMLP